MAARRTLRAVLYAFRMAPFLSAFLIAAGIFIAFNYNAIAAEWREMYPSDPNRRTAIQLCYIENHQFMRSDTEQRDACYDRWLPVLVFQARLEKQRS
jgi:hypothetical protein